MKVPSGLRVDDPAFPLLQAHISYWGITSAVGGALGTTLVCADLANEPGYAGLAIKLLDGDAAGQVRQIMVHDLVTGIVTVAAAFTDNAGAVVQVTAGTRFVILSIAGGAAGPPPAPPAPGVSLWMFGVCDPGMGASTDTLVLTNLAGFNDAIFANEFWIQVIHNVSVPGAAPEREIRRVTAYAGATGTFTVDDFSADVEANDLVCVFHESIMAVEILGFGTIDTSSATVPADSARPGLYAWEVNNYFRGCLLMTTEGATRFAPRRIVEYTNATGVFTLDPNNPFPAASGDVDYIIIGDQTEFVPAADGVNNRTPSDVIGNKTSTPIYVFDNVSDAVRYLKGIIDMVGDITTWTAGQLVQVPFFVSMDTVVNDVITLFDFDALGATIREVHISFYMPLHAAATFTLTWEKTRPGAPAVFTAEVIPTLAPIVTPGAAQYYRYHCGEIAEGLRGRFRIAQSNDAPAITLDAYAVVVMEL